MKAEIISIGTELLLGDIIDTNAVHIAQMLRGIGLDLLYKTTVGDNEQRIAEVINDALARVDVVITSGGLGPTVDDVTREAIARATSRPLEFSQELLDQIADRFHRFGAQMTENNRRQAMIPQGALPIENPVGTAPIFILETSRGVIMTLPGVPREMKYLLENSLLPWLTTYIGAPSVIQSLILRTAGIGESQIDSQITDLMQLSNPTVGLAAHSGQTDIRVTAKAASKEDADALITPIAEDLRSRLGNAIYGTAKETIEEVVANLLKQQGVSLTAVEIGTLNALTERIDAVNSASSVTEIRSYNSLRDIQHTPTSGSLEQYAGEIAAQARTDYSADYGLAVIVNKDDTLFPKGTVIGVVGPSGSRTRKFGWSTERTDSAIWATTHALAVLRRMLLRIEEPTG